MVTAVEVTGEGGGSLPHVAHVIVTFWRRLASFAHFIEQNCKRIEGNVSYSLPQCWHTRFTMLTSCESGLIYLNIIPLGRRLCNQ
jgi:hypothetical protein